MMKKQKGMYEVEKQDDYIQITTILDDFRVKLNFSAKPEQGVLDDVKKLMIKGTVEIV